jgi:hypothetical protein
VVTSPSSFLSAKCKTPFFFFFWNIQEELNGAGCRLYDLTFQTPQTWTTQRQRKNAQLPKIKEEMAIAAIFAENY